MPATTAAVPATGIQWEVYRLDGPANHWMVEGINHGSEGEMYWAEFSGQGAEARAREYAAWKTSRSQ